MKIYYTGDCHFDFDKTKISFKNFINQIKNIKANDLLVIFGDIHNNRDERIKILQEIDRVLKCKCVFVIGNHDFWNINYKPVKVIELINSGIDFIDDSKLLKNIKFKHIIVLDNEIKKINGVNILGSSGYNVSISDYEIGAYIPREINSLKKFFYKRWDKNKQKHVNNVLDTYMKYYNNKNKEFLSLYKKSLKKIDIVVTHQPTWTWMNGKEKLEKNIKYINGHDHYSLKNPFTKRIKGHAFDKTADNNYNDGQNTYHGIYKKPIKYFEFE